MSLVTQSSYEFEWIVIDDGSSDGTKELLNSYIEKTEEFHIYYYFTSNGGKHRALNYGVGRCHGEYVFIVDSDDTLANDAIEIASAWIQSVQNENVFAGVAGLRGTRKGEIIGEFGKSDNTDAYIDATNLERKKYRLYGDKAEIYKKDIF